jgi:hypothetical protein
MVINPRRQVKRPHWLRSTRALTRSPHPEGAYSADAPNPRATVHKATKRSPCHGLDPPGRATSSPPGSAWPLPPAASADTKLTGQGIGNVLSYRHAPSPESSHARYSMTKALVSRAIGAQRRADPSHPIPLRMWPAARARDGDSLAFLLVRACMEPPAGIEPATPSLPSMRRWSTTPCDTARVHTTAQVRGAINGSVVGRDEVACSTVFGKFLARPRSLAPAMSCLDSPSDEGGAGPESLRLTRRPAGGLPIAGQTGIMGGMPEADSTRKASPTSPSGSRTAAHAAACGRPRPPTPDPCRVLFGSHGLSVRPTHGGGAVSARRGRLRPVLIPRRGRREPGELPRPEQNPTQPTGIGALIDLGG